ncbi:putative purine nucleoside phosphorylase [Drechslerella stenobrocha 248]|uniref:Purine nucleoside phosphorylase n=1 Tax=Drechslerella stenobrocha 248 TaxID=1043628 RepID=W7HPP0_9PEZI|nr:putative purine nucleoside phosphorylase [Drechslerella stenobrocha 248]
MTSAPGNLYAHCLETAKFIQDQVPQELRAPAVGVICGSGLGGLADTVEDGARFDISYSDIPNFPQSTVQGHAGKLVFGYLGKSKTPAVLMVGRAHFYEGHNIDKTAFPVRVMKLLGVKVVVVTNAAGGLNPDFEVGDICLLNDHINFPGLSGLHPLRGPNAEEFGPRFPPMSDAYDLELRKSVHTAYKKLQLSIPTRRLHEGVYAFVSGPSFETRAECRLLRLLGADVVGMSTVPEIIAARHAGMRILAMSLVTNKAVLEPGPRGDAQVEGDVQNIMEEGAANHLEVLEAGKMAANDMQSLVRLVVDELPDITERRPLPVSEQQ